jgi:hypothetical protein
MHGEINDFNGLPIDNFKSSDSQIIFYQNDGSERQRDGFSIRAVDNTIEYMVNVTINLINDAPEFAVNPENVFKPIEGFSNLLTKEFLFISDPDSDPSKVKIFILGQKIDDKTYLHTAERPNHHLKTFTLKQLESNQIYLKQKFNDPPYRLIFKAKDEYDTSSMVILYTEPATLSVQMIQNDMIEVQQGQGYIHTSKKI